MRLALVSTLSSARASAEPPTASERDPYVPMPKGIFEVSPCTTSTASISTPSLSAMICAKVVSWPWPWLWVPVKKVTEPVGCTRTSPHS